jgi:hypothetical protein
MKSCGWKTTLLVLISVLSLLVGCSSIEIVNPPEDGQLIITPHDLEVVHKGCGQVKPETFKAELFSAATDDTEDITGSFTYSNGTWSASDYPLKLWGHKFSAQADVETGTLCFVSKRKDERNFYVVAPTCIKGKTKYQFLQSDGTIGEGFWAGAKLEVYISKTNPEFGGQFVASTVSDESGDFCIDRVPAAIALEIKIPAQPAPPNISADSCSGATDNIIALNAMETCGEGDCNDVGSIKAFCGVD